MSISRDEKTIPKDRQTLLHTPFEYTLYDSEKSTFGKETPATINFFGCPEDDDIDAIKRIGKYAKEAGSNADFHVLLGDNNTPKGVTDSNSSKFKTNFHEVHDKVALNILGNHDVPTEEAALAQIEHTFVNCETGVWDSEKIQIWNEKEIDLARLRKSTNNWNMPGRYGIYHLGVGQPIRYVETDHEYHTDSSHTDLFVLDSSSFVTDFINYFLLKTDKNPNNQAAWFFRAMRESKRTNKIVLSHHPFHDIGKRNIVSDHLDYLKLKNLKLPEGVTSLDPVKLLEEYGITGNYNEMLNKIMFIAENKEKGIEAGPGSLITLLVSAHHHASSYLHPDPILPAITLSPKSPEEKTAAEIKQKNVTPIIPQWIAGGAGGPKQERLRFDSHRNIPFSTNIHGFLQLQTSMDAKPTGKVFTEQFIPALSEGLSDTVVRQCVHMSEGELFKNPRDKKLKELEEIIISACDEFQAFLAKNPIYKEQPKYKGTVKALDWVPAFYRYSDDLKNFCNQLEGKSYNETLAFLKQALKECVRNPKDEFDYTTFNVPVFGPIFGSKLSWTLNTPNNYFETLAMHQQKFITLFERRLKTAFSVNYTDFISDKFNLKIEKPSSMGLLARELAASKSKPNSPLAAETKAATALQKDLEIKITIMETKQEPKAPVAVIPKKPASGFRIITRFFWGSPTADAEVVTQLVEAAKTAKESKKSVTPPSHAGSRAKTLPLLQRSHSLPSRTRKPSPARAKPQIPEAKEKKGFTLLHFREEKSLAPCGSETSARPKLDEETMTMSCSF